MAVYTGLLCRPKLIRETIFHNIGKMNTECVPKNTNNIFISTVSIKKDNLNHCKGKRPWEHTQKVKFKVC